MSPFIARLPTREPEQRAAGNFSVVGGGAGQIQVGFRETCASRKSALTCCHDENATSALEPGMPDTLKAGNPMDKIIVIFSLVGLAIWLSHTAAKKRGKIHERID
jgi:hypothetical protein